MIFPTRINCVGRSLPRHRLLVVHFAGSCFLEDRACLITVCSIVVVVDAILAECLLSRTQQTGSSLNIFHSNCVDRGVIFIHLILCTYKLKRKRNEMNKNIFRGFLE